MQLGIHQSYFLKKTKKKKQRQDIAAMKSLETSGQTIQYIQCNEKEKKITVIVECLKIHDLVVVWPVLQSLQVQNYLCPPKHKKKSNKKWGDRYDMLTFYVSVISYFPK